MEQGQTEMDQAVVDQGCIYSRLAGDPDLWDIVDMFVDEMPDRINALLDQLHAADWDGLRQTAHRLKGAAGSYGFDAISPCAGRLESALENGQPEQKIRAAVEELVELCKRMRHGLPTSGK